MIEPRYFVRWRTEPMVDGNIRLLGWDVCDRKKFDKVEVASFAPTDRDGAEAICKLLNSIEDEGA